jgi:hypothetical protein
VAIVDIASENIYPGHASCRAHLRARAVARAYKRRGGGRGMMTNDPVGWLARRLIPAFPRRRTTMARAAAAAKAPSLPTSKTPRAENLAPSVAARIAHFPRCPLPFPPLHPPPHPTPPRTVRPSVGRGGSSRVPARAG